MNGTGAGGWAGFAFAVFAIISALFGVILLLGGIISYFAFSYYNLWVFVLVGILFVFAGIFWLLARQDEKRYYANRAKQKEENYHALR